MSDIITATARTPATIAAEIRAIHEQAERTALMAIVEIGKRLVEAKELVDHGEWCSYLKVELGYKQSAANNYMRIYREYEANGLMAKSQTFGNLSPSQALALIAIPSEEREAFAEENDVENMTARQLQQAIRERDEARQALKDNQAELAVERETARLAQQELLDAQQKVSSAKSSEEAWQAEIDKLKAAATKAASDAAKAKEQLKKLKANPKISDELREQISAEAAAKAAEQARAELQKQLASAEQTAQTAAREREQAEATARALEEKLAAAQKNAKASDPDVMAFNLLASQIRNNFNTLHGYQKKMASADPEMGEKMKSFMIHMLNELREKVS